jgi:anti-sigma-K factor RskA
MTRDHGLIEELLAAKALGGLDADDDARLEREMAAHGDCDECRGLEAGFAETAGMLGFSLEPAAIAPGGANLILARAARDDAPVSDELAARRARRVGGWRTVVVVAASVVAVAVGAALLRPAPIPPIVQAQQSFVPFEGGSGTLTMAYTPGEPGVVLWGDGLPAPGSDKVYELWMIEDGTAVRAICLRPDPQGRVSAFLDADLGTTEVMAVTVESTSCPDAPTDAPVYVAELS